jgi:hypothetical protein
MTREYGYAVTTVHEWHRQTASLIGAWKHNNVGNMRHSYYARVKRHDREYALADQELDNYNTRSHKPHYRVVLHWNHRQVHQRLLNAQNTINKGFLTMASRMNKAVLSWLAVLSLLSFRVDVSQLHCVVRCIASIMQSLSPAVN